MKGNCASCLEFDISKVVKSKDSLKPTWLLQHDYVSEFINNHGFKLKTPNKYDVVMDIDLGIKFASKKILYWAANEKETNIPTVVNAKQAYGNFKNSGVIKTNDKGKAIFKFKCPQLYKAKRSDQPKPITFFRHLHFVVENNGQWLPQIYTKIVVCNKSYKESMKIYDSGYYVFINALPSEYFAKDHIPNSYNLHHSVISKMTTSQLESWFYEVTKLHYPKLFKYIKNKKIDIYEIPIITYCAHKDCNASEMALKELMKKGFVNINEYGGGIQEYRKFNPHD